MRDLAGNLLALAVTSASLAVAIHFGMRWGVFAAIVVGVFVVGYTATWLLLRLTMRRGFGLARFLVAPLWLAAGAYVALAAYESPSRCGPGLGVAPYAEVAGRFHRDIRGGAQRPCLPEPRAVAQTLIARIGRLAD